MPTGDRGLAPVREQPDWAWLQPSDSPFPIGSPGEAPTLAGGIEGGFGGLLRVAAAQLLT